MGGAPRPTARRDGRRRAGHRVPAHVRPRRGSASGRLGIDAYNRRDIDRLYELAIADFEWVPAIVVRFEGESVRGRDGMEAYFREVEQTWADYRLVADEIRDLGDQVLVIGRIEVRGRASGLLTDTPWGCVFHFREGKLARAQAYLDHGEALQAVGLSD